MITVAIVGLGQIGGSIGMALVKRRLSRRVIGIDNDAGTRRRAMSRLACHETGPLEAIREAGIVILAAPAREIVRMAQRVMALAHPDALITDVGSTKRAIQEAYRRAARFVPGHPLCGTERAGIEAADPELFAGAKWVLAEDISSQDATMSRFVLALGARPLIVDSRLHDRAIAYSSHLPYVLALLLSRGAVRRKDHAFLAAGSFRSATRVAAQPPAMGLDMLITNRFNISREVATMARNLARVAGYLREGNEPALRRLVEEGRR
ncbi:MAG: prephenate [Planctomycetota bacterium]|nr:MAG: prephenate [Planctomycetota bacterium]